MLQSIAWAVLAFLGLSLYTCGLEVTYEQSNPAYFLYFIYFFNRECATVPDDLDFVKKIQNAVTTPFPITSTIFPITTPFKLPEWPEKFGPVDYTHDLMLGYAVLSVLWAVTSIIIVGASALHVRSWVAYVPWIIVTIGNIVMDVVATISFAGHVSESQTAQGLLNLIGLQNIPEDVENPLESVSGLTMIPSLIMALLSSRVVVFWLLNVLLVICVSVATRRLYKDRSKRKAEKLPIYPNHTRNTAATENNDIHTGSGSNNAANNEPYANKMNLQPDYEYVTGSINNNRPFSYTPDDPTMMSLRPASSLKNGLISNTAIPRVNLHSPAAEPDYMECLEPSIWPQNPSGAADNTDRPPLAVLSKKLPELPSEQKTNYDNGVKKRAPDINRTDSDRLPYRLQPSVMDTNRRPQSYEEVKPLSRMSPQTSHDRLKDPNWKDGSRLSGSMPPDELRSQLPWSYFGPRNVPMKPKQKQTPVVEEELEKPPVPVPDYTLHFGKTNRPSTSTWSEDGVSANHRGAPAPNMDRNSNYLERSRY
ncbi:hypothetical protein B7P43_G04415 [Cryptotermes secundus]|uniref:Uncharacterized protein n=1 Tax=Cryptotermes secundus TaxID=105785 RepID=A0A2J7QJU1_9NEOP|nr:uncharacterized protein LOC111867078 isoform X3 [Cryptotermes secundus]PNF28839.1 hypothetical protein B7P43_G04415 [Cryptotermes secundus]